MACCGKNVRTMAHLTPALSPQARRGRIVLPQKPVGGLAASAVIAARREACAACAWNDGFTCQHFGCLPCQDRKNGGLTWKTSRAAESCPEGRWKV